MNKWTGFMLRLKGLVVFHMLPVPVVLHVGGLWSQWKLRDSGEPIHRINTLASHVQG